MLHRAGERSLQSVVGGVVGILNDILKPVATDDGAGAVEGGVRSESWSRAWVCVGGRLPREAERSCANVARVRGQAEKAFLEAERPGLQEGIPEVIPTEACYLGWQESLVLLTKLVEAEIPA